MSGARFKPGPVPNPFGEPDADESERLYIGAIGSRGQLGSALLDRGAAHNIVVSGFSRPTGDLLDEQGLRSIMDFLTHEGQQTVVINAAAYTAVDKAESDSERAFAVNRDGARNLAEVAHEAGAMLVHVSTDYVFDGSKSGAYVESDPIAPLGVYGCSKAEGEAAILEVMPENAFILRTAWVYGLEGANFVKTMLRLGAERDVVRVVDDQRGSPTFADDLADAILSLVRQLKPGPSKIYHAAGHGAATWYEVAREIFAETARRGLKTPRLEAITTAQYPTPAKRPANSVLDCSRLERDFGIKLPHWRDGLHRMLNAHLDAAR